MVFYCTYESQLFGTDPAEQTMYCMRFEIFNGCSVKMTSQNTQRTNPNRYTVAEMRAYRLACFGSSATLTSALNFDGGYYSGAVVVTINSFLSNLTIGNTVGYNFTKISVTDQKGIDIPKAIMLIKQWRFVCSLNHISIAYNGNYYSGETIVNLLRSQYSEISDDFDDYTPAKSSDYSVMETTNELFQDWHYRKMINMVKAGNYSISIKVRNNTIIPGTIITFSQEPELADIKFRTQSVKSDVDDSDFVYINAYKIEG